MCSYLELVFQASFAPIVVPRCYVPLLYLPDILAFPDIYICIYAKDTGSKDMVNDFMHVLVGGCMCLPLGLTSI